MAKKIKFPIVFLLIIQMIVAVSAQGTTKPHSWYFKPRNDNKQPAVFEGNIPLDKYNTIYLGDPEKKKVYLTFDAGYENGNVKKIVDVMDKYNVKGTFFVLPHFVKENSEMIKQMAANGHIFGNHTRSHKNMCQFTDYNAFSKELTDLEDIYRECTGLEMSKYYRPPEGSFSEQNLEYADKMGYSTVFWSFAYADWDNNHQMNPQTALNLVLSRIHNGCVLLLHPTSATNAAIMEGLITRLKEEGYEFGTIAELKDEMTKKKLVIKPSVNLEQVVVANRDAIKRVALTFDDGPAEKYTPEILDILKQYNAKGTFFVIGKNAEKYPDLIKREISEGHEIGNHTYSHPSLRKMRVDDLMNEIAKTSDIVYHISGARPKLFRPPGGYLTDPMISTLSQNEYTSVLWSWRQDTKDWRNPSVNSIVNNVMRNLQDGDIILFHDYHKGGSTTPKALQVLLPKLAEKGYSFVTVSELIRN